jgi:hypothetical protein
MGRHVTLEIAGSATGTRTPDDTRPRLRRVRPIAALLAVALTALALVPAGVAVAGGEKLYRDKANKFSCSFPDNWDPVPVEPGEDEIIAKFAEKNSDAKGVYPTGVSIYRLGIGTKPAVTSEDPFEKFKASQRSTDLVDLVNKHFKYQELTGSIDKAKGKAITSRDDVPGFVYVTEAKYTDPKMADHYPVQFHLVAVWQKPGENVQYGMWFKCFDRRKKFEPMFRAAVDSFRWFDDKAKDVTSLTVLDGVNITPAKRSEIERGLVKGWNVVVSTKKNYIVIYNTVNDRNNQLAKVIGERIEMIREQVYEKQFPPKKKIEDVCIVRVCGGRGEYAAYGGPGGSAGYWSPGTEELVFYDASPAKAIDDDTVSVLYHEAFHQYIYYSTGRVSPHSWFNEGHGDYYAGAKLVAGKFVIKPFNWRLGTIKNALRAGPSPVEGDGFDRTKHGYTPLNRLTAFTQGEYYSYPDVCYAQGWSLIYFFREIVPKNPKWNAKWGKILETYFNVLQGSVKAPMVLPKPVTPPAPPPSDGPGMDAPSMDDPMPGDPGMDGPTAPSMGDEPLPGEGTDPLPGGFTMPTDFGPGGGDLKKALDEAFKGFTAADWKELEDAWHDSILKLNG